MHSHQVFYCCKSELPGFANSTSSGGRRVPPKTERSEFNYLVRGSRSAHRQREPRQVLTGRRSALAKIVAFVARATVRTCSRESADVNHASKIAVSTHQRWLDRRSTA